MYSSGKVTQTGMQICLYTIKVFIFTLGWSALIWFWGRSQVADNVCQAQASSRGSSQMFVTNSPDGFQGTLANTGGLKLSFQHYEGNRHHPI